MDPRFKPDWNPTFESTQSYTGSAVFCRSASHEILVFLNNDIEATDPKWLMPLVHWAAQDEVGAVGARLLDPNGCLQHVGMVLGMEGVAGHVGRQDDASSPGYLNRRLLAHEVAAVTGAWMAVQRSKFDAVGGFDEILPNKLSDIDLCLRERGWRTIVEPTSVMINRKSAGRGDRGAMDARYDAEGARFMSRWREAVRDDPYFHPALSLASTCTMLD